MKTLTGPFTQILPLTGLPLKGPLRDEQLHIIQNGWVLTSNGRVVSVGNFERLHKEHPSAQIREIEGKYVLLPGFIDCHTHICFAGNRAMDYAMRIEGKTYFDISRAGGGIWESVVQTRNAGETLLTELLVQRAERHWAEGVTIIEVKSGYGLIG